MKTLTRRAALAAVPALAVIPAMAAVKTTMSLDLPISPELVALIAEYERLMNEQDKLNDASEASHVRAVDALEARGIVNPGWPAPKGTGEAMAELAEGFPAVPARETRALRWIRDRIRYDTALGEHPDEREHNRLYGQLRELSKPLCEAYYEILKFEPQSFADLAEQFEQFTRFSEDSEIEEPERRFLERVAINTRRLAGVS